MAEKSHMPYLAIVVLVAVVAVVVVVLNARPSSEEAVAGEATRTLPGISSIVYLSGSDIASFYPTRDFSWSEMRTGAQVCKDMGYRKCLASETFTLNTRYDSTDGSCSGDVPEARSIVRLAPCDEKPFKRCSGPNPVPVEESVGEEPVVVAVESEPGASDWQNQVVLSSVFCGK